MCQNHRKDHQRETVISHLQRLQSRAQGADEQIKHAQWEKLRQVMLAQIKKATQETSKNTIYSADREVPTTYDGWKAQQLGM